MSASVGCAVFPHDGTEPGELLDAADSALLNRKSQLANRARWQAAPARYHTRAQPTPLRRG
jgi:predicted signal transduction protein with EAL and GGDEF domain